MLYYPHNLAQRDSFNIHDFPQVNKPTNMQYVLLATLSENIKFLYYSIIIWQQQQFMDDFTIIFIHLLTFLLFFID